MTDYELRDGTNEIGFMIELSERPTKGDLLVRPNGQNLEVHEVMLFIDALRRTTIIARCSHRFLIKIENGDMCKHCDKEFRAIDWTQYDTTSGGPQVLIDPKGSTTTGGAPSHG